MNITQAEQEITQILNELEVDAEVIVTSLEIEMLDVSTLSSSAFKRRIKIQYVRESGWI